MPVDLSSITEGTFIFVGLTLGLLSLIWVVYRIVSNHGHDWRNAIQRNTDAFTEHSKSITKLGGSIESSHSQLSESIKDLKDEIRSRKR